MNSLVFTIGQKIRDLRNNERMTLGELAAKINVSPSLISQLERGGVNPSISLLKLIADALEVPLPSLFEKEEAMVEELKKGVSVLEVDQKYAYESMLKK